MTLARRLSVLRDALEAVHASGTRGALLGLALALILLSALLGGDSLTVSLRYDRSSIAAGEWWRLLTGQFVHLDAGHALANAAGAVLVWALVGAMHRAAAWAIIGLAAALATAAGLWWGAPEVRWYVGASGWLHGLLAAGAWTMAKSPGDRLGRLVLLVLVSKLLWEQVAGPLSSESSGAVIVDAHSYGALGGFLCAVLFGATAPEAARDRAPL